MNDLATCAACDCSYFKQRSVRPLCGRCEAEDDAFRELMAERVRAERAWNDVDLDELRAERDRLRPLPLTQTSETASSAPRSELRWVKVGRHFALRQFPVAQSVKTDAWGRPVR